MTKVSYLLVAEKSVHKIIRLTISALEKYADPDRIYVVVPSSQIDIFRPISKGRVVLISEEDVLPQWPLSRIKLMLSKYPSRAGWYLQQFLKLSFSNYAGIGQYVIWDADTVMLKSLELRRDDRIVMNANKKLHKPYFDTYRRLFGFEPTLKRSMISQYMLIDHDVCLQMQQEICRYGDGKDWIEVTLRGLPQMSISEFSEYETYANYLEKKYPDGIHFQTAKWFLYGSEIFPNLDVVSLEQVEKRFCGYSYVAFERHPYKFTRRLGSRLQLILGL